MSDNARQVKPDPDTDIDADLEALIERYLQQLDTVEGCRRVLAEVLAKAVRGEVSERMAGILRGMVDSASRLIEAEARGGTDQRSSEAIRTLAEANARAQRKARRLNG